MSRDRAVADDVMGTAVALLRAYQLGDEDGFDAVLNTAGDARQLAALLVGLLDTTGAALHGVDEWRAACAVWQPGQRIGD